MEQARFPRAKTLDIAALALCAGAVGLSTVLTMTRDGRVPFPAICLFRAATHVNCPGCGLLRSFVAMGHLDCAAAWRFNRVGPLLYAFALLQIPYRAMRLAWPAFLRRTERREAFVTLLVLWGFVGLLVVNWVLTLARVLP